MEPASRSEGGQTGPRANYGKYVVVRQLGSGGMAQVFEGRHPELGSPVALKVLRSTIAAQPLASARFSREAKVAAQLRHPNVVRVFDLGIQDGVPYIVMEFLEGQDLQKLLLEKGPLPLGSIVELFLPIISGVETAHKAGIIHRDLKPANVMLTHRPQGVHPFVLDFGISKTTGEDADSMLTRSESLLGTVQYMAPELTRGAKFATAQSDQYALGVMLYECATGRRPFSGASYYELMHAIVTAPVTPPSHVSPSLPAELDAIVLTAMSRDPAQRFPSVQALGRALVPLGDRVTAQLWEGNLTGRPSGNDLWSRETGAASDVALSSSVGRAERKFRGGNPWGPLALGLVAGGTFATLLFGRFSSSTKAATLLSSVSAVTAAPALAERSELPAQNATSCARLEATQATVTAPEPALRARPPSSSLLPSDTVRDSKPGGELPGPLGPSARPPKTHAPGQPALAPSVPAAAPGLGKGDAHGGARPPLGTNGAPIID